MRLIMIYYAHGKTTTDRYGVGCPGTADSGRTARSQRNARSAINTASRSNGGNVESNRRHAGGGPCYGASPADAFQERDPFIQCTCSRMGRTPPCADERGGGEGVPIAVAGTGESRGYPGDVAVASGVGATTWEACCRISGVSTVGAPRLEENRAGHASSPEQPNCPGGVEKKLPETLASVLKKKEVRGRRVRLMFQDEARFGRMVRIRRCWAPTPFRPVVANGYEREFVYVYGAVSPIDGELDWKICREMNTGRMGEFLQQVSKSHPKDFIVMILDGASSHKAKALTIPENIRLLPLPPYSPELNPQEHVWDELREKEFPNRVFNELSAVVRHLETGLPRLSGGQQALRSLTAWPWIVSLILKDN